MPTPYLGMAGNGTWAADQRPKNWREKVLHLAPNGMAPLTAIMSKLPSEKTDDPEFNWWEKKLPDQGGALQGSGVYIDAAMTTAYSYATHQATYGIQDAIVYVKATEAIAGEFRKGHTVLLRDTADEQVDTLGIAVGINKNGNNSRIDVKLQEADDNGVTPASNNLATVDRILLSGDSNPEGGVMPDAIGYLPTKYYNYAFISKTPISITETAKRTRLRTGDQVKEARREAMMLHAIQNERHLIYNERREWTGDNGQLQRTSRGLLRWIASDSDAVKKNFRLDSDTAYAGKTWLVAGEHWLDTQIEQIARWNESKELICFCGSGALLGIQRLAKFTGSIQLEPKTIEYGIKVTRYHTVFNTLNLITHPLFSFDPIDRYRMVIFDPRRLRWRFIRDTQLQTDPKKENESGFKAVDAQNEQFLTEGGLQAHHTIGFGQLDGIGQDNAV